MRSLLTFLGTLSLETGLKPPRCIVLQVAAAFHQSSLAQRSLGGWALLTAAQAASRKLLARLQSKHRRCLLVAVVAGWAASAAAAARLRCAAVRFGLGLGLGLGLTQANPNPNPGMAGPPPPPPPPVSAARRCGRSAGTACLPSAATDLNPKANWFGIQSTNQQLLLFIFLSRKTYIFQIKCQN